MDFKEIINQNKNNVKSIIKLITKETNEDLEQEVYIKVWKNRHKYEEKGKFKNWINVITKNLSKDYVKSAQNRYKSDYEELTPDIAKDKKPLPELRLINNERQIQIINAINSLKPKFKEVILFCEVYGYTYEECAQKLKCPVGTVKSRIYNAKKELALKLENFMKG